MREREAKEDAHTQKCGGFGEAVTAKPFRDGLTGDVELLGEGGLVKPTLYQRVVDGGPIESSVHYYNQAENGGVVNFCQQTIFVMVGGGICRG